MTAFRQVLAEARDQAAHMLAGIIVLGPVALFGAPGFILSAVLAGLVRETAQHDTLKIWRLGPGSLLDLASGWLIGGLILWRIA